jgi:hypothetical protein
VGRSGSSFHQRGGEAATRQTPNAKRQTALSGYNLRFQEDA